MTTLQDMLARQRGGKKVNQAPRKRHHFGFAAVSEEPPVPRKIRVVVLSYERPDALELLLQDLHGQRGEHEISVVVYDDASRLDYSSPRRLLDEFGWDYIRSGKNHGKRGFWRWVHRIYAEQQRRPERLFVTLPDDMRLCSRFFDRALNVWTRITDPDKVALNLMRDNSRDGRPCWTDQRPQNCGPVLDIGWVDGAILCNRRYFKELAWKINAVDPARWRLNPRSSSGVGEQISWRLHGKGLGMYGVKHSLIAHVAGPSKMNAAERQRNPLLALHFVDGEAAHRQLAGATAPPKRRFSRRPVRPRRPRNRRSSVVVPTMGGVKKTK